MFDIWKIDLSQLINLDKIWMFVVFFAIFLWLITIIAVSKDISARTNNHFIQIISILFVTFLTPIVWLPIYLAIRPIWYKKDKTPWRESCLSNAVICTKCGTLNPKEYNCCIGCGKKLKVKCKECEKEFVHDYQYCPYCWAPNLKF